MSAADVPFASVVAQGRSTTTGRRFNLAVAVGGDLDRGAPSFVTETPGTQIKADPTHLEVYKDYVRNPASWLQPVTSSTAEPETSFCAASRR